MGGVVGDGWGVGWGVCTLARSTPHPHTPAADRPYPPHPPVPLVLCPAGANAGAQAVPLAPAAECHADISDSNMCVWSRERRCV